MITQDFNLLIYGPNQVYPAGQTVRIQIQGIISQAVDDGSLYKVYAQVTGLDKSGVMNSEFSDINDLEEQHNF